jgi:iron(III) transport system ATP-binding protein
MVAAIRLEEVSKAFGPVSAVRRAGLDVAEGEFLALLGPSGCGKTTLLRLVSGLEEPDGGTIDVAGRRVAGRGTWVAPERRRVGLVFQDYSLFPHLTAADNVAFGLSREAREERVRDTLALVGLEGLGGRYPHELSGGQQQRVAVARALAPNPSIVLLDEPWSNVDPLLRSSLRAEIADILRRAHVTTVLVTHEQEEAFTLADRIALMRAGEIVQVGTPEEIYFQPADRWAASFVGVANFVPGRVASGRVETSLGSFPAEPNGHATVDVLLRPELLELTPDADGAAEVVERVFLGHDVFYRVRLADGTIVASQRPSTEFVPLGARVSLRPHATRVATFA